MIWAVNFDDTEQMDSFMPRTAPRSSGSSDAATRLKSILDNKGWSKADLISNLVDGGMKYHAAHALVGRILSGKGGSLQDKTREKLERALGIEDASTLSESHHTNIDDARAAVVASLTEAPKASDEEIIKDIRSLLKDKATAPYLRMATKILKHLS